ncbi:MAG: fructosamine kinase family protein [Bacteroidota bacterium]|nr:fructosamine kinase family protein [Bacteroidota bacterium]
MSLLPRYSSLIRKQSGAELLSVSRVSGGSINCCLCLESSKGLFFLKENSAQAFPGMFEAEKKGLDLLKATTVFRVPAVYSITEENGFSMLLMEWLEKMPDEKKDWRDAGQKLAQLHKNTSAAFGLNHDNYIGSLPQSNTPHATWADFFAQERILPQLKLANDEHKIDQSLLRKGERFCSMLKELFPAEAPSLLHGDLWSGNFFFSTNGPALFDPAVYYGHREMDLAMTKLFGGFDPQLYEGYEEEFPLEKKWKDRTDFCNLYPLLVHVNLFGGGYVEDVKSILKGF